MPAESNPSLDYRDRKSSLIPSHKASTDFGIELHIDTSNVYRSQALPTPTSGSTSFLRRKKKSEKNINAASSSSTTKSLPQEIPNNSTSAFLNKLSFGGFGKVSTGIDKGLKFTTYKVASGIGKVISICQVDFFIH